MKTLEWLTLDQVVSDELIQAREEGKDVSGLAEKLEAIRKIIDAEERSARLNDLYREIVNLDVLPDYPYVEPANLKEIQQGWPEKDRNSGSGNMDPDKVYDRIYGAWLGRCAGCLLGKPVEGMSRSQVSALLRWKNAFPLRWYIREDGGLPPNFEMDSEQVKRYATGVFENVERQQSMLRDDDIDYTILGLSVLEKHGLSFTPMNIGEAWLQHIPLLMTYTAERVAYRNLAIGLEPPSTSRHHNPYREWIGAQIRGDIWGYVSPGNPAAAADLAYRDAVVSHQKNGVYGELFVSAAIAAAAVSRSVNDIVTTGVSYVPRRSRFAEMVESVRDWCRTDGDWQITRTRINEAYGHYNWFHTLPNAAIVVMALLYSDGDFEKGISIAVMSGLDTDCNGATVGSILGMYLGSSNLPTRWIEPLSDRVQTAIIGESGTRISDLARRTIAVMESAGWADEKTEVS